MSKEKSIEFDLTNLSDSKRRKYIYEIFHHHVNRSKDKLDTIKKITLKLEPDLENSDEAWLVFSDHNSDFFGFYALGADEHNIKMYRGMKSLMEDPNVGITSKGSLNVEDLDKIVYIEKLYNTAKEEPYNRTHVNCLFEQLRNISAEEIAELEELIDDDEYGYCHLDVFPTEFFTPDSIETIEDWPIMVPNYVDIMLLKREGKFELGTLTLPGPDSIPLTKSEQSYFEWICDKSGKVKKPIFNLEESLYQDSEHNAFKKIFKKNKNDDLSLEF